MERDDKKELRRRILSLRDGLDAVRKAAWDAAIADNVLRMEEYREADAVLAYASYRGEVDTRGLLERALADGKAVFAPRVLDREMEFWRMEAMSDLREGYRGIPEPEGQLSFPAWLSMRGNPPHGGQGQADDKDGPADPVCRVMMWMPGVVFDRERNRIGYGGGFYDRYLGRLSADFVLFTAALAYGCQVLDAVPCGEHDVRPDRIVTERGVIF